MTEMNQKVYVVENYSEDPRAGQEIPEGWRVFNAPRPIYGHMQWQGPFRHGIFYTAVDPNGDAAEEYIERNRQLDAAEVVDISRATIEAHAQAVARKYGIDLDEFNYQDFAQSWLNRQYQEDRKVLR